MHNVSGNKSCDVTYIGTLQRIQSRAGEASFEKKIRIPGTLAFGTHPTISGVEAKKSARYTQKIGSRL